MRVGRWGLTAGAVPEAPSDVIVCDSIRRFKGLEKPVVVLVELRPDDERLERLLYIGSSRARQHLRGDCDARQSVRGGNGVTRRGDSRG